MSEPSQQGGTIGGYVAVALITAAVMYFMMGDTSREEKAALTPPPAVSPVVPLVQGSAGPVAATPTPIPIPPPKPSHNYDSAEGYTYYYGAAISEEERKTGKSAPDMLSFWYLGRDDKGRDLVQRVINGRGGLIAACGRPCKVVHSDDGRAVGFNEGSIIGGAIADAQRGLLKKRIVPIAPAASFTESPSTPEAETPST